MPKWGDTDLLNSIDFDDIYYYIKPQEEVARDWDDVSDEVKNTFDIVKKKHPHINFVYLTFSEATNPKRTGSIDYLKINKAVIGKDYGVFCLSDNRREAITPDLENQWVNFVQKVNRHLV